MKVGILGGGQLGRMLLQAAANYDLTTYVLEKDPNCPAAHLCHHFSVGDILYAILVIFILKNIFITIKNKKIGLKNTLFKIGGFISVPMAAISFTVQYAMGATATYSTTTVLGAMVGTHILIGIGEGLITGLTVSAVIASRSDLVYGWKNNNQKLEIRHA